MAQPEPPSRDATLLSEERLRHMSRHIREVVPDTAGPDVINDLDDPIADVYRAAASSGHGVIYRVAAWNTLCALLEQCSQHADVAVRSAVFTRWWTRSFDLYLSQAQSVRPKSARQLLATLAAVLQRMNSVAAETTKGHACVKLLEPLVAGHDHGRAKICALAMTHFVSKGVFTVDDVVHQHTLVLPSSEKLDEVVNHADLGGVLYVLFQWVGRADFGSTIGQLVSVLLDGVQESTLVQQSEGLPLWASPLRRALQADSIDVATLRAHLLPTLLKRSSSDYFQFLDSIGFRSYFNLDRIDGVEHIATATQTQLLCASVQVGKDSGMLRETEARCMYQENGVVYLPIRNIAQLLHRESSTARLTALSLLVTSRTSTRPLHPTALKAVKKNLHHLIADTDANFRSEVCGLVQRLIDRIRAIMAVAARQSSRAEVNTSVGSNALLADVLQSHADFLSWLIRFLQWELRPTASYQRHISALKCILIVARSGLDDTVAKASLSKSALAETQWPMKMHVLTSEMCDLLLDRVIDPFDDVRQMASAILTLFPADDADCLRRTEAALIQAERAMLASGRADLADGVAYLYKLVDRQRSGSETILTLLLEKLDRMIKTAQSDLDEAVARYPIHGLVTSLRYVLEQHQKPTDDQQYQLVGYLNEIWIVVKPVLCDDAPEGYMAEDAEETDEVSTKDTLSYCWRALKESSMLLATLLQKLGSAYPTLPQELSELCFTQLAELRHRGAFSTVAQTWIACCVASCDLCTESGQQLLPHWYAKVVAILRNNMTINTRRSAGLPALLCGLLVADGNGTLIKQAFHDLEGIARILVASEAEQEGSLPQVHAMNCLKDVLKNSRLAEASEKYVPVALKLAADALQSSAWAIRNCGLMLFRAVIDRLLGTSDAHIDDHGQVQKQLSVDQHPQLLGVVLGLLRAPFDASKVTTARSEGVFPALQLLQRLEVPETQAAAARQAIYTLMGSSQWHVREKAARTYAALVARREAYQEFERLLDTTIKSQSALHGALLSARHIMKKSPLASDGSRASILWDRRNELYTMNACPVTKAAYVDLLADSTTTSGQNDADISVTLVSDVDALQWTLTELRKESTEAGSASTVRLALAQLLASQLLYTYKTTRASRDDIGETINLLARHDANACTAFVVRVATLSASGVTCTQEVLDMLAGICVNIDPAWDVTLKCETFKLLLRIGIDKHAAMFGEPLFQALTQATSGPLVSATLLDLQLQWRAAYIERCSSTPTTEDSFVKEMRAWIGCCTQAVKRGSIYSCDAAALAIAHLDNAWSVLSSHPKLSRDMISLCMAIYDLLNDDDEEIRMLASTATSRILAVDIRSTHQRGIQSAVANERLLIYMVRKWSNDLDFADLAMCRAFGDGYVDEQNVDKQVKASMRLDTALFAEEKQNLYIDEAREVKAWSQVVMQLQSTALHKAGTMHLSYWADNGLKALTAQAMDQRGHPDWCSQPGIFTLGLQVIYGAECLLRLVNDGVKLGVRPSAIRRQLAVLVHAQDSHDVHYLWQEELRRILKESLTQKLIAVHGAMSRVCAR
ncbi:hypothetical protein LTR22_017756 [Elasticomyces elasticus]|nr:hypothetical protein LTR22_017756 [Elasticomyces elasticus]KAK4913048.1 hypothetical protein LTR49_018606 [Elasticomyces elasticus]KAK5757608.1 hypothetical protein LTS12_012314 [Elasticomyces elasticus]